MGIIKPYTYLESWSTHNPQYKFATSLKIPHQFDRLKRISYFLLMEVSSSKFLIFLLVCLFLLFFFPFFFEPLGFQSSKDGLPEK